MIIPDEELDKTKLNKIERYGRICYKSESKITQDSSEAFIANIIKSGHESVIEHEKVSVVFVFDRGVSHEAARQRLSSISQESTRYCNYSSDKFGNEIAVVDPFFFIDKPELYDVWKKTCLVVEEAYMKLRELGASPQEARSVLPNSLKTEFAMTCNMREWRHIFRIRCQKAAHPQMRQVMIPLLLVFKETWPALFGDIPFDAEFPDEQYAEIIVKASDVNSEEIYQLRDENE